MQFRDERRTAVILCTGESAARVDLDAIRRFPRIAVNDGYILDPTAEFLYAADPRWWEWHGPAIEKSFRGRRFCCAEPVATRWKAELLTIERKTGLSRTPGTIFTGGEVGNSGAQAINLAYLLGARRIVLVGMDMQGSHFFGDHPKPIRCDSEFKQMVRGMSAMACELDREGVQVVNTSDVSHIVYWPGRQSVPEA